MNAVETPPPETDHWSQHTRIGCCSAYALLPLLIFLIAAGALLVAFRAPRPWRSQQDSLSIRPSTIAVLFTPEVQHWSAQITEWSTAADLDPNLAATVMQIESCGDPRALSRAGAIGLFQVMPYHFGAADQPFSPSVNAARGLAYLSRALQAAGGDARLALAGYNGGIGLMDRPEWSWPSETTRYAYWGTGIYSDAVNGLPSSSRLNEWLAAGGSSLCLSARTRLGLPQ